MDYAALKTQAINLRKEGFTYSEILKQIPVAKSTLSLWLQDIGLSKKQTHRITTKQLIAAQRGGEAKRQQRITRTEQIHKDALKDIGVISKRELWLIGVMLYWAEGSKEKSHHFGSGVRFTNSDAAMIRLFLRWLADICNIEKQHIIFDITIHTNHKHRTPDIIQYWANKTGYDPEYFTHIYYKQGNPKTNRTNVGESYYGIIRISVRASSTLLRRIAGWTKGVIEWAEQ
ncbi:MAG: hypothetical protein ACD_81C00055G0003 [uncultured bacterium]|uniref:Resolvase helix-turn-helix domain protein n=1 Tax=Candidatus Wolfebacteria bacterium GW2011_GWE2_44_13 TaxID=1619017 RepID=A0A0G1H8X8_9BACT|nr:MAG: hypothetical protein ACD_81C00055G0003 [uncultured bacterium]KKT42953.1 MAG: hypothetical protein UW32_C0003G0056 [Candidatus Wolfebacteria bacterium GW2011_GWE2_44_13]